jgi:hypothetical protein
MRSANKNHFVQSLYNQVVVKFNVVCINVKTLSRRPIDISTGSGSHEAVIVVQNFHTLLKIVWRNCSTYNVDKILPHFCGLLIHDSVQQISTTKVDLLCSTL